MVYSVPQYLNMLRLAKRSPATILEYRNELGYFAKFLKVPLDELHKHLLPENLINYAATRIGKSEAGTTVRMGIISRYYKINGVKFDEMELNILKARSTEDQDDKPLELETLQKMMDLGDIHAKAIISFLISTGVRAGELTQIKLSDISEDTVKIRNEIAKGKRGGTVYLTAETQEYLALWMKDRDRYRTIAAARTYSKNLPEKDQRLFLCSYSTLRGIWSRLYDAVDGETGKYGRGKNTIHSARKYFRTLAVKTMPLDVVEKIMRHSGYLTRSYVRISDDETRRMFHEGEHVLYITRRDQRLAQNTLEILQRENKELTEKVAALSDLERRQAAVEKELQMMRSPRNDQDTRLAFAQWLKEREEAVAEQK